MPASPSRAQISVELVAVVDHPRGQVRDDVVPVAGESVSASVRVASSPLVAEAVTVTGDVVGDRRRSTFSSVVAVGSTS